MKLLSLFALGAAADFAAILSDIAAIGNATEALTMRLKAYRNPTDTGLILLATQNVTSAIEKGQKDVDATQGPLSTNDALALINPTTELKSAVIDSINATIAKRDAFESKGLGLEVKIQLEKLQSQSVPFSNALVALVPQMLQSTAKTLAQPINDALQRGVDAYANATDIYPSSAIAAGSSTAFQILSISVAVGFAVMVL